jgi:hypothetical protein
MNGALGVRALALAVGRSSNQGAALPIYGRWISVPGAFCAGRTSMMLRALCVAGLALFAVCACERTKAAKPNPKQEPAAQGVENSISVGPYKPVTPSLPAKPPSGDKDQKPSTGKTTEPSNSVRQPQ